MNTVKEREPPDGFFRCGFCMAIAPNGNHVCGDKFTEDRIKALKLREQKERRLAQGKPTDGGK